MSSNRTVRVGSKTYRMGNYLASGQLGTVYPAWEEREGMSDTPTKEEWGSPQKAIKKPNPKLDESGIERFWAEYEVLKKVNNKWSEFFPSFPSPFLQAEQGQMEGQDVDVLVMEFVPEEWELSTLLLKKKGMDREKLALEAALQYARLLKVLHAAGYTCTDRKVGDLFFDEEKSRLIVLDWNVVKNYTPAEVQNEHGIFATLWYQFLVGKNPPVVFNPLDDETWLDDKTQTEISLGTRELLTNIWFGRYANNEGKLAEDIKEWLNQLQQVPKNPSNEQDLWRKLVLLDLAKRLAPNGERQQYESGYKKAREDFDQRFDSKFFKAQLHFQREEYEQGLAVLERMDKAFEKDQELELQRERWRVALRTGQEKSFPLEVRTKLSDLLNNLARNNVEKCNNILDELSGNAALDSYKHLLNVFKLELDIRQLWETYQKKRAELSEGVSVSNQHYEDIWETLKGIKQKLDDLKGKANENYAQSLRCVLFPTLEEQIRWAEERADTEKKFFNFAQTSDKALHDLTRYLENRFADYWNIDREQINRWREFLNGLATLKDLVDHVDKLSPLAKDKTSQLNNDPEKTWEGIVARPIQDSYIVQLLKQQIGKFWEEYDEIKKFREQVNNLARQVQTMAQLPTQVDDLAQQVQTMEQLPTQVHNLESQIKDLRQAQYNVWIETVSRFVLSLNTDQKQAMYVWADLSRVESLKTALSHLTKDTVVKSLSNQQREDLEDGLEKIQESLEKIKNKTNKVSKWIDYIQSCKKKLGQTNQEDNMTPPDQPPVIIRESKWPMVLLSISAGLGVLILAVIAVLLGFIYSNLNTIAQHQLQNNQALESPTPTITPTVVPTVVPTPVPAFQFSPRVQSNFTDPIEVGFTYSNLDPKQVKFQILGDGNVDLSSNVPLNTNETNKVIIPAEKLVGQFTLRASLNGEELAAIPIEILPPQITPNNINNILEVQPALELNGKYILVQSKSKIVLKEEYKNKGWSLSTQQQGFSGGSGGEAGIVFEGNEIVAPLTITITMEGVYDNRGDSYKHNVEIPVVKFSRVSNQIGQLLSFDIGNACSGDIAPGRPALDLGKITALNIFEISELCDNNNKGIPDGHRLVMIIANIQSDQFSKEPGLQQFPVLKDQSLLLVGNEKPEKPTILDGVQELRYFVIGSNPENQSNLEIMFFGLLASNP